ncbi:MAG: MFS transporter [Candidatus Zixiibacteriota bacterium]
MPDRSPIPPGGRRHLPAWWGEYLENLRRISVPARWFLLGTTLIGMAWATFMLLFNLYMKERGFAEGTIGHVLSMQSFGMVALAVPAAMMVARRSARGLMIMASIGVAMGFLWQTLAGPASIILLASFATGSMIAFSRVMGSPFLMKHSTHAERTHVFSLSFAATLSSGLLTHFAAGSLHRVLTGISGSPLTAYRIVLLLGTSCALGAALAFSRIPRGVVGVRGPRLPLREFWRVKGRLLFRLIFPFFLVGMGAGLIIPFLNLYFNDRFGLSAQTIGFYYALVQASMIVGVMIGPELARRFGMIRTIVFSEWASLPFMVIMAFTHNLPLATAAFVVRGALMNLGVPISNNYMMERVGESDRALANSWSMVSWSLSWAITTWIGGTMIEHLGYEIPLIAASVLYVASSVMYYVYFRNEDIHAGRPPVSGGVRPGEE